MRPGDDPLSRLRHRGSDRQRRLRRHDLAADPRRAADARASGAAGSGAGRRRRSRPAGAVDRRRAHGDHLRRRHQQRHGLRHQHAGRRAWRCGRAMRRVLSRRSPRAWAMDRPATSTTAAQAEIDALRRRRHDATSPASAIASIRSTRARRACSRWSTRRRKHGAVSGRFAAIGRAVDAIAGRAQGQARSR